MGTVCSNLHSYLRRSGPVSLFYFIGKETEVQEQAPRPWLGPTAGKWKATRMQVHFCLVVVLGDAYSRGELQARRHVHLSPAKLSDYKEHTPRQTCRSQNLNPLILHPRPTTSISTNASPKWNTAVLSLVVRFIVAHFSVRQP